MLMDAVIFDVDGTIVDVSRIRHLVQGENRNFDRFHELSTGEPIIEETRAIWHSVPRDIARIVVTARQAKFYTHTLWHLLLEGFGTPDDMFMRGWRDQRPDAEVKRDILALIRQRGYNPILAVDDNPNVLRVWREEGVPVWHIQGFEG